MSGTPEASRRASWLWWSVAIFFLASIVSILDRQILNLLVDPVRRDLHISDVQISLLQGASFAVFYSLVGLPLGFCADRFSRRWLLILGVFTWSLATVMAGLARDFEGLFVARICVGFGEATLSPCVISMIRDLAPAERRGRPISVFLMGQSLGTGISILMVGAIIAAAPRGVFDAIPFLSGLPAWRIAFVICGALGFIVVAALFTIKEPPRDGARADKMWQAAKQSLSYFRAHARTLAPIYLGFAGISVANYALGAWGPTMLIRTFGIPASGVGAMLGSVTLVAGVVGALSGGFIADRSGRSGHPGPKLKALAVVSLLYMIGGLAPFAPTVQVAIGLMAVSVVCLPISGVLTLAVLHEVTPAHVGGVTTALMNIAASLIGMAIGPLLVASLTEGVFHDPRMVGMSLALTIIPSVIVAAVLYLWAKRLLGAARVSAGSYS